jgi:UDP-glucose 4-epimerase
MFDLTARAFRFGNVVGPRQTHGVDFDFLRQLLKDPSRLRILGDGTQSKSYIYVLDVIAAVLLAAQGSKERFAVYNVATDYITVTEIAHLAAECAGLDPRKVMFEYTGGNRGWKRRCARRSVEHGANSRHSWTATSNSREALRRSMMSMMDDLKAGRL